MGVKTTVAVGAVGVAAGLVARSLVRQREESEGDGRHPEGWKSVTVLGDAGRFAPGSYPAPLQRLADLLEIRTQTAPGDKGFEVHARIREGADVTAVLGDDDPEQALRAALRDAKQVIETGEVLRAKPRPHGHRPPTPLGALVDKAEDDAKGEGVL
jgi:hypothetical protein